MSTDGDYRQLLVERELRIGEGYDKTLITLSGGALGLTLTFVTDFVGPGNVCAKGWLLTAWVFWSVALASLLAAYYFGQLAYKKAREQFDEKTKVEKEAVQNSKQVQEEDPIRFGGIYNTIVNILNVVGGVSFLIGLIAIIVFTFTNLGGPNERTETPTEAATSAHTSITTTSKSHSGTKERLSDKGDSRSRSAAPTSTKKGLGE